MIRKIAFLLSFLAFALSANAAPSVAIIRLVDIDWRGTRMPLAQVTFLRELLSGSYAGQDVVIVLDTENQSRLQIVETQINLEMNEVRAQLGGTTRVPTRVRVMDIGVMESNPSMIAPDNATVSLDLVDPGRLGLRAVDLLTLDASQNLMTEATREFLSWAEMLAGVNNAPHVQAVIRIGNTHLSNLIFLLAIQSPQQGGAIALGTHASYENLVNNTFVKTMTNSRRPLTQVLDALARYREAHSKGDRWARDAVLAQTGITSGEMSQWINLAERGVYAYHESLLQFAPRMAQAYVCKSNFN